MKTRILGLAGALLLVVVPSAYAGNWSMFHHDVGHGGGTAETIVNSASAATLTQAWAYAAGSAIYSSPAIVKHGDREDGRLLRYQRRPGGCGRHRYRGEALVLQDRCPCRFLPRMVGTMSSSAHGITRC